ncbi:MAG: protein kinase [Acidobacteria bacterium]|nr:protein kinase [Acidobacteriota bacterium]
MLSQNEILRDRYKIIRLLGQGGMGAVYDAYDSVFDTSVALKEIVVDLSNANNTKAQEMVHAAFEREAKLLAKINHETFPHVKDYFAADNRQFLVMELVDGEDLSTLLKQRGNPFPVSDVLNWADQLLDGLDYLHNQSPPIIHRDLKPQNLKLNSRGKIKLLDFGIAKGADTANTNTVTDQTFVAATLNYSPIEQMLRVIDPTFLAVITHKYAQQIEPILEQNADTRSDIYALGATIYNLLTAASPVEAVKRGVDVWDGNPDPLQRPNLLNPAISENLADWIMRSMQIRREHRFSTAAEMRAALNEIKTGVTQPSAQKTEVMNFQSGELSSNPGIPAPTADFSSQTGGEHHSVETIAAPNLAVNTGQPAAHAFNTAGTQANTAVGIPETKRSLKFLWAIPVFILLFMFLGVAGLGAWWFLADHGGVVDANTNTSNENTIADSPDANVNRDTTTENPTTTDVALDPVPDPSVAPSPANSPNITTTSSDVKTPAPVPVKTPQVRQTPKTIAVKPSTPRPTPTRTRPTPQPTKKKKNMNCIFTDDC